jgi:GNAT superfamily N-acetyltransferase
MSGDVQSGIFQSLLGQIEAAGADHLSLYGGEVQQVGPLRAMFTGPELPVNVVCGFGNSLEGLDSLLDSVEAFYTLHGLPSRLALYSHFADWEVLAARGYRLVRLLHVHTRPLDTVPDAPELTVRVFPPAEFARLSAEAFGPGNEAIMQRTAQRPRTQFFAAEIGGQPAAAGAMSVFGNLALLFSAATLPQFRGQGAQTALLAARVRAATEAGATGAAVMTTPGSASERNVRRAGFGLIGARLSFERP